MATPLHSLASINQNLTQITEPLPEVTNDHVHRCKFIKRRHLQASKPDAFLGRPANCKASKSGMLETIMQRCFTSQPQSTYSAFPYFPCVYPHFISICSKCYRKYLYTNFPSLSLQTSRTTVTTESQAFPGLLWFHQVINTHHVGDKIKLAVTIWQLGVLVQIRHLGSQAGTNHKPNGRMRELHH